MMLLWIDRTARPGWMQMALDRSLMELAGTAGLNLMRLYLWDRPTISFGANESALRHWDRAAITSAGIATVRRPTGGRAVWHDPRDLTYAVVGPVPGVTEARRRYRKLHQELLLVLSEAGWKGNLAPQPMRSPDLSPGGCFDSAAGGEVVIEGRKTIGSAQLIQQNPLLQHGEIARAVRSRELTPYALRPTLDTEPADREVLPPAAELASLIGAHWQSLGAIPATEEQIQEWLGTSRSWQHYFQDSDWTWRR